MKALITWLLISDLLATSKQNNISSLTLEAGNAIFEAPPRTDVTANPFRSKSTEIIVFKSDVELQNINSTVLVLSVVGIE
mgnify:CR=1 FL=1